MAPVFTVIAPGGMGGAVGRRLADRGAEIRTSLTGRSAASHARAEACGMRHVEESELVEGVDIVLSIVPPGEAAGLARRFAPLLLAARRKPVYLDCNAISPQSMEAIASILAPTGALVLDCGIIGGPPRPQPPDPNFYVSGPGCEAALALRQYGLEIRLLPGPPGAASALKVSYAGLTKGLTALGAAMFLGAAAAGSDAALIAELGESQPEILRLLRRQIPGMYDKAYRWVAEMREIANFVQPNAAAARIYEGAAGLYEQLAAARAAGPGVDSDIARLEAVLHRGEPGGDAERSRATGRRAG
jgi:3-hydroxyisobutyrate dehydrogenase-like beta-hydroxyacid dehydrogenase